MMRFVTYGEPLEKSLSLVVNQSSFDLPLFKNSLSMEQQTPRLPFPNNPVYRSSVV